MPTVLVAVPEIRVVGVTLQQEFDAAKLIFGGLTNRGVSKDPSPHLERSEKKRRQQAEHRHGDDQLDQGRAGRLLRSQCRQAL